MRNWNFTSTEKEHELFAEPTFHRVIPWSKVLRLYNRGGQTSSVYELHMVKPKLQGPAA